MGGPLKNPTLALLLGTLLTFSAISGEVFCFCLDAVPQCCGSNQTPQESECCQSHSVPDSKTCKHSGIMAAADPAAIQVANNGEGPNDSWVKYRDVPARALPDSSPSGDLYVTIPATNESAHQPTYLLFSSLIL